MIKSATEAEHLHTTLMVIASLEKDIRRTTAGTFVSGSHEDNTRESSSTRDGSEEDDGEGKFEKDGKDYETNAHVDLPQKQLEQPFVIDGLAFDRPGSSPRRSKRGAQPRKELYSPTGQGHLPGAMDAGNECFQYWDNEDFNLLPVAFIQTFKRKRDQIKKSIKNIHDLKTIKLVDLENKISRLSTMLRTGRYGTYHSEAVQMIKTRAIPYANDQREPAVPQLVREKSIYLRLVYRVMTHNCRRPANFLELLVTKTLTPVAFKTTVERMINLSKSLLWFYTIDNDAIAASVKHIGDQYILIRHLMSSSPTYQVCISTTALDPENTYFDRVVTQLQSSLTMLHTTGALAVEGSSRATHIASELDLSFSTNIQQGRQAERRFSNSHRRRRRRIS